MNKPIGAIDGDKAAKWIDNRKSALKSVADQATGMHKRHLTGQHSALVDFEWEMKEGAFALSSNQPEATKLREALTQISSYQRDQYESPLNAYDNCKQIAREALSSHREGGIQQARTQEEWHEDFGDVLWWTFPIEEPPYVGSPLDSDWPGYHTHWTVIPIPGITEER